METFLFMTILAMLVIAIISFIVLKKKWQFSIKLFLVGLIGFALPVMMIEGPIKLWLFLVLLTLLNGCPFFMEDLWLALLKKQHAIWFLRFSKRKEV